MLYVLLLQMATKLVFGLSSLKMQNTGTEGNRDLEKSKMG